MAVDKHQEATECFYEAKRIDATMWNAWCVKLFLNARDKLEIERVPRYGLGLLKFSDEDLHSAAIYFSYALRINGSNPVGRTFFALGGVVKCTSVQTIMVHNAVTLARLGRTDEARCLYVRALDISPMHIVGRYHYAQLHYYEYVLLQVKIEWFGEIAVRITKVASNCAKNY